MKMSEGKMRRMKAFANKTGVIAATTNQCRNLRRVNRRIQCIQKILDQTDSLVLRIAALICLLHVLFLVIKHELGY
jgi:hypothetical protein